MSGLTVTALGVGHGDAILLEWRSDERDRPGFTCLVDGGESTDVLHRALDARGISKLDLLLVSHFDADHIGGLSRIAQHRQVQNYWGPALPAFHRHLWLFGDRVRDGIDRARLLEESLVRSGANLTYPLEGFTSAPTGHEGPVLRVLSPAARIIRTLLVSDSIEWLVAQSPTPLGWLAEPAEPAVDQPATVNALDEALLSNALTPEDLRWVQPAPAGGDSKALGREWGERQNVDPEFFGDSILNNTSIVLWIDAPAKSRRRGILLSGDQENWTYLLLKHPFGLQADIFKAPHHGGSLYIENDAAHEEIFSAVRPAIVLFSANGRHKLPHAQTRASAIRWGATVCCTSRRGMEFVTRIPKDESGCCHDIYRCSENRDVSITLGEDGLSADSAACHSGFGTSPGPVIQVRQHRVEGSPVLQELFEHELRKHLEWLKKKLKEIHSERVKNATVPAAGSEAITVGQLATLARSSGRHALAFQMETVLPKGWERRKFWCSHRSRPNWGNPLGAYALPSEPDIAQYIAELRRKTLLLFTFGREKPTFTDRSTLISNIDRRALATFCDAVVHYPTAMFDETLWPDVVKELLGSWHCYKTEEDSIGLSRIDSARQLCHELYATCFERDSGGFSNQYIQRKLDSSLPVIAIDEDAKYNRWGDRWFHPARVWVQDERRVSDALAEAAESMAARIERLW